MPRRAVISPMRSLIAELISLGMELRRLVRGLEVSVGRDSERRVSPRREVLSWVWS
jgi:hypothetical protein